MPKALIFVIDMAKREEYSVLKNFLTKGGFEAVAAVGSRDVNINYNIDFMTMSVNQVAKVAEEFDLLALAGGYKIYYHVLRKKPPLKIWDLNIDLEKLNALIQHFYKTGKTIIAPLAVPGYLAQLGLLKGKDATVYPITELIKILRDNGANFVNKPVVKSGGVITAKDITTTGEKEFLTILRETT
ncbi:DJ-1/PfpI family protein [Pyrobaculum aerophilum]|uniref:Intracellular protease/amidase n=1 Tax=Pyrobaculum aerophilum TaxID=13773 RepID=A0A371R0Z2_9CREN|nr:DJ-1/PfpI family protein [Pyrobaculum aerophilum]RFA96862.1 intracellular protease/amidase [Pyrobaculum aerophilum]RFA97108.1 intracellular protease/amidase [Pyrobaculum aerophilum]